MITCFCSAISLISCVVVQRSLEGLFEAWRLSSFFSDGSVIWRMIPSAIFGFVQKERNDMAFRGAKMDAKDVAHLMTAYNNQVGLL